MFLLGFFALFSSGAWHFPLYEAVPYIIFLSCLPWFLYNTIAHVMGWNKSSTEELVGQWIDFILTALFW